MVAIQTGNCSEINYVKKNEMPIGYRFSPTEEELLQFYLVNKVLHLPLPHENMFQEIDAEDMYRKHPKCVVKNDAHDQGEREWFAFIHGLEYLNFGGRISTKIVGNEIGFWRFIGEEEPITRGNNVIGFKIYLNFFSGCLSNAKKTYWRMQLYRLPIYENEAEKWILGRIVRGRDYSCSY